MNTLEADTLLTSSTAWAAWIAEQEAVTGAEYCRNPKRLLSDHRAEASVSADYVGREILELLQNAADAATEVQTHGCVHVELNAFGLLVANTGAPFTRAGVDSLRLAEPGTEGCDRRRDQHTRRVGAPAAFFPCMSC